MYHQKTKYKFWQVCQYHNGGNRFRQGKLRQQLLPQSSSCLLLAERLAVGALIRSGIHLVGTHQNLVQGAVVLVAAVMGALLDSTLDALVCMTVH